MVKLTQAQADAIEYALSNNEDCYNGDKDRLIRAIIKPNIRFHNRLCPLNKIDIAVLSRALYIGYEVESKFKVGDWVTFEKRIVSKITEINDRDIIITDHLLERGVYMNTLPRYFKHATDEEIQQEKQRRWWKKHDRKVWELKQGDLILKDSQILEVSEMEGKMVFIRESTHFILSQVRELEVICFAEDRKDV